MIDRDRAVKRAVVSAAELMVVSAVTAPKARGMDNLVVKVLEERGELLGLAEEMEKLAPEYGAFFARDADNVRNSDAVLLIGCKVIDIGLKQPKEMAHDLNLVMSLLNLGIAIGSAVKTASMLNVDNRVMYTAGLAAKRLGLVDADIVVGVPLSAKAKNIYFDRKWPKR